MSVVESEGIWLVQIWGDELWTKQLGSKQKGRRLKQEWKEIAGGLCGTPKNLYFLKKKALNVKLLKLLS